MNMTEDYAEVSVKGDSKKRTLLFRLWAVVLFVGGFLAAALLISLFPKFIMIATTLYVCICIPVGVYFIMPKTIEYDYLYLNSDIDIDAVLNQNKRKKRMTIHMEHVKRIAPVDSASLKGYEGQGSLKVKNFTSGVKSDHTYAFILEENGKMMKVILEPTDHMLELLQIRNRDIFYQE